MASAMQLQPVTTTNTQNATTPTTAEAVVCKKSASQTN